jgi:ArsR family transcriptional regulator
MVQVSSPPRTPRQAARRRDVLGDAFEDALHAGFFAALADPTRLRLIACIARCRRACSVGEIAECCSVDLSVVSRHLKALERAGVLASEREGRAVRYRLRADEVSARLRVLADAIAANPPGDCDADGGCCGTGGSHGCC